MSTPLFKPHEVEASFRMRACRLRMPAAAFKILWAMHFGVAHGVCYAGNAYLAEQCGVDASDIGKLLRQMVGAGLLEEVATNDMLAAIRADGGNPDSRLTAYKRVLDPDVNLSPAMAGTATIGNVIDRKARVKLKPGKPTTERELKEKIQGALPAENRGNGTPEPESENVGNAPLLSEVTANEMPDEVPLQLQGTVDGKWRGDGTQLEKGTELEEGDGLKPSPLPYCEEASSVGADYSDERVGAPKGADLSDDQLWLAETLFGELSPEDRGHLHSLVDHLGPRFELELVNLGTRLEHGRSAPLSIAEWAAGLGAGAGQVVDYV